MLRCLLRVQSEICEEFHHSQFGGAYAFNRSDFFCNKLVLIWLFGSEGNLLRKIVCSAVAAAAKSLQSCPTLCDPRDGSPPGFPNPGILRARTLEWVAISFSNKTMQYLQITSAYPSPYFNSRLDYIQHLVQCKCYVNSCKYNVNAM